MTQVITCENVTKSYVTPEAFSFSRVLLNMKLKGEHFAAVREVSLSVPKGKIVAVLGRNGAGKSTLLRIVGGVYVLNSGVCKVVGRLSGLYEMGLGANPKLTGREYAYQLLTLKGFGKKEIQAAMPEIEDFSELGTYFDRPIHTYSMGMTARLYFSVITAKKYDVYLIDEALSVGDEYFQRKCWARVRDLLLKGASGILVTHDWSAALKLCDWAYVLDKGQLVLEGPVEKTVRSYLSLENPTPKPGTGFLRLPEVVHGVSEHDLPIRLKVGIPDVGDVHLHVSVELLRKGFGWEIVILHENIFLASEPGEVERELVIPRLPLYEGEYTLNLFLSYVDRETKIRQSLDVRSWTYGNAIPLRVSGMKAEGGCRLPLKLTLGAET